jgi:CysZ protein
MSLPALRGPHYLGEGLKLILQPGLRVFVILPLTINLLLFVALIGFALRGFDHWMDALMATLPQGWELLRYILWPVFVVLLLLIVFFTFTLLANIVAAPFNGFLAEKVEVVVRGRDHFPPFSWSELFAMMPRTFAREMRKLRYYLPRVIALLLLSLVPGLNLLAAPLWALLGVWMMAVQYIDYPADNNKLGWNEMLAWLQARRWQSLSFGGIVYLALLVPLVNLLIMPAAVAGATLFWVREGGRPENERLPPVPRS